MLEVEWVFFRFLFVTGFLAVLQMSLVPGSYIIAQAQVQAPVLQVLSSFVVFPGGAVTGTGTNFNPSTAAVI